MAEASQALFIFASRLSLSHFPPTPHAPAPELWKQLLFVH